MRWTLLLPFIAGVSPCLGQEPPPMETMVITASRQAQPWLTTPAAVSQLDVSRQLPGIRIDSAELLQGLPGLQVDSRSNYAQDTRVTLRGFGARSAFGIRGLDVRVDTIPLSMPDGQAQIGSVFLEEIQRVEVLRGPLAGLYGNGAGGVLLLETRPPSATAVTAETSVGSFDSYKQSLAGAWRSDSWGGRVQGAYVKSEGYRPHSAVERYSGGAQLYYDTDNGIQVRLRWDTSHDPETEDPSGLSPEQWRANPEQVSDRVILFNTRKKITHNQFSVSAKQQLGQGDWQLAAWHGTREVDQWLPFEGEDIASSGAVIDLKRDFTGLQGDYTYRFEPLDLSATVGASVEKMEDDRRGYVNDFGVTGELRRDETGTVDSEDVYGLLEWQPLKALTLLGGARYSRSEFAVDDDFIVNGNPDDTGEVSFDESATALGLTYRLNERWAAFINAGTGFETPTLTEMAYRNEGTGLNTALTPSRNEQVEAGLRHHSPVLQWALVAFGIDTTDELVVDQSEGGRTTYANAAATERRGVELEWDLMINESWSTRASATWLDTEYSEGPSVGNRLPGVARQNVYAQLRWRPWQSRILTVSLAGRYRSKVAADDDNAVYAPDYTTFDLALDSEHDFAGTTVSGWLRLANITDEKYVGSVIVNQGSGRSFEPAPGRHFDAGIRLRFY